MLPNSTYRRKWNRRKSGPRVVSSSIVLTIGPLYTSSTVSWIFIKDLVIVIKRWSLFIENPIGDSGLDKEPFNDGKMGVHVLPDIRTLYESNAPVYLYRFRTGSDPWYLKKRVFDFVIGQLTKRSQTSTVPRPQTPVIKIDILVTVHVSFPSPTKTLLRLHSSLRLLSLPGLYPFSDGTKTTDSVRRRSYKPSGRREVTDGNPKGSFKRKKRNQPELSFKTINKQKKKKIDRFLWTLQYYGRLWKNLNLP